MHLGERKVFWVSKVFGGIYVICTVIHWVQNYSGQPFRQFWQRRRRTLSCRLYLGGRTTCGKTKCLSGAGPDDNLWQIIMFGWDDNRCQTVYVLGDNLNLATDATGRSIAVLAGTLQRPI